MYWIWEDSATSISNGRLEMAITMRNDSNTTDGLVVRMTSSYYRNEFHPSQQRIVEDGSKKYVPSNRQYRQRGQFYFQSTSKIPDNQNSADRFYVHTAHSRLDDKPFTFTANTSFDAAISSNDNQEGT